jgi:hypothetical protein
MKRTNFYLTEQQLKRLQNFAEGEGCAVSEVIRRSIDVYLAWNDPAYNCASHPPERPSTPLQKDSLISPCLKDRGFTLD